MSPPIPKPGRKSAAPKDRIDALERELNSEIPEGSGSSRASDSPPTEPLPKGGKRTPKNKALEVKIARSYMVLGTVVKPFRRFYPPVEPISNNLKSFSQEAAEAWVDLAEEDPKVRKVLESFTTASTWGNVVGIHFAIFMAAVPTPLASAASGVVPDGMNPIEFGKMMGLSDAEIQLAMRMAGMETGGPGDTVRTGAQPMPPVEDIKAAEDGFNAAAGMATPGQMGVQNPGDRFNGPQVTGGLR